jgi:hypothetical protein
MEEGGMKEDAFSFQYRWKMGDGRWKMEVCR